MSEREHIHKSWYVNPVFPDMVMDEDGTLIADIMPVGEQLDDFRHAYPIAAGTEMLAALEEVRIWGTEQGIAHDEWPASLFSAIAKATGGDA